MLIDSVLHTPCLQRPPIIMPPLVTIGRLKRWTMAKLSRRLRGHPVLQSEILILLTIVVSLVCGGLAVALHRVIELVAHVAHIGGEGIGGSWHPVVIVLTPTLGGLLVGLLLRYVVPAARGSGIPQVKVDLVMRGGHIPLRVALGKFVCTALSVGSGASVGREGPTVQMCASIGSSLARFIPMTATQLRMMVHAACVAGVAAAFNTPIAGVTFVMEEIIGDLSARHVTYFIFAAVSAAMISRHLLSDHAVFDVPQYTLGHPAELILYVLLGVLAGILSVAFIRLLIWSIDRFQTLIIPSYLKPALGGLIVGTLALYVPHVLGGGYQTITAAMQNQLPWIFMGLLVICKFIATVASYSSGTAGGLFAPSLFLGAMLGGSLAGLIDTLSGTQVLTSGAFALVGMGAVFVGVIRTPMTSILIIFEMTNDYALILPLMLANMTSYAVANFFEPHNVYEAILAVNKISLPSHEDYATLDEFTAADAMVRHPVTIAADQTVSEAVVLLEPYPFRALPVVQDGNQCIGMIALSELCAALEAGQQDTRIKDVVLTPMPVYAYPDYTLHWVLQQMGTQNISVMPVISRGHPPRLVGVLTVTDIARAFARHAVT